MTEREKLQEELIEELDHYYLSKTIPTLDELAKVEELKSQLAELKEEEPKQSAEEFLKSKCLFTYAEIELITPLLEEYRQQGMREELIKYERYLHGLDADKICELSTTDIIDEYLNKWKGE